METKHKSGIYPVKENNFIIKLHKHEFDIYNGRSAK